MLLTSLVQSLKCRLSEANCELCKLEQEKLMIRMQELQNRVDALVANEI